MPDPAQTTTATTASNDPGTSTVTATSATTIKPGIKTTEYWFAKIVAVIGALMAAGYIADGTTAARICGGIMVAAAALGYPISRGLAKLGALLLVLGMMSTSTGCDGARARGAAAGHAGAACAKASIKAAAAELVPSFLANVRNALDAGGKLDRPTFREVASPLKSAAARCALDAAIAAILNPPPPDPNAPQSEPLPVDKADVAAAYDEVRASWDK